MISKDSDVECLRYNAIVSCLRDIKLVQGPVVLQGTLNKHPIIKNYLINFQKHDILEIEGDLQSLEN